MIDSSLRVEHLQAFAKEKQILYDISCRFEKGKVTVLMGPNGSGKSTLAHVIMGDPKYTTAQNAKTHVSGLFLNKKNILNLPTEEKARLGLFLSFQSPIAIPGVSVKELLRASFQNKKGSNNKSVSALNTRISFFAKTLHIDPNLLNRAIHEEFSGGERKKIELLQALILQPAFAIFDEIDTGVDVDALKIIAKGVRELQKQGSGIVLITHSERILQYIEVDTVMVMVKGKMTHVGSRELIDRINRNGYRDLNTL
ncbi:MAG: FeS assembly ATPase SufC [Candidatus Gottesmanbacteria bacterium GW2011_GWA2_44_17]|uniref:FeS assembly ATPase SufC n=2 Tax=Candidatus Gottesmaniibacteriota TaxID=1752720 RepID=A0A0G1IQ41_9BACT|nr:MAG: FeS assembly ATPase SufC [Microgenomates group bacterium GW2011_GWC1_43_11]KKT47920.1 MAG: FeS assembly ATPase SufC [Candidatus Gottesmanbacteria bacterium GW2011_GWA2_44_17]KKT61078.1 MAG: FeS assembly ATPase SufC [Candidatus Gottesmanbacteria bacterium GW2011_GWA1_44_24b]HCM82568.1 Fe-S cluster assembly ATPase SufC [Patescibacteria group bacterium]